MTAISAGQAPVSPQAAEADDGGPSIEALRARGGQRLDPVHFRFIEALARRATAQDGDVGRLLRARIAELTAALAQRLAQNPAAAERTPGGAVAAFPGRAEGPAARSLLADLVHRIDGQAAPAAAGPRGEAGAGQVAFSGELKALRYFRSTWSGLRVERQLAQSLAQVPENAGPLHSDRLVLRALQAMREISPAYLGRFMSGVDTLIGLDQLDGGDSALRAKPTRGGDDKPRQPLRARALRR